MPDSSLAAIVTIPVDIGRVHPLQPGSRLNVSFPSRFERVARSEVYVVTHVPTNEEVDGVVKPVWVDVVTVVTVEGDFVIDAGAMQP